MIAAGSYTSRVRIERRGPAGDDGYGNTFDAWAPLVTRWADWRPQTGRETVAAGRMEATRPGTLRLRRDGVTATIAAADRVVFVAGPEPADTIAAIRSSVIGPDEVELVLEVGAPT